DASAAALRTVHRGHGAAPVVGGVRDLRPALRPLQPGEQQPDPVQPRPSGAHWFGTDSLGRDVLSRVIVGSREILIVSVLAPVLGTALGTALGLVMGYFRGILDNVVGRIVDAVLSLPIVIVAFMFVVAVGPSARNLVLLIGLVFGLIIARTVRTAVLQEREL